MADRDFFVENGIVIENLYSINATGIYYLGTPVANATFFYRTANNALTANTANNATNANNASYLGGSAAASFLTTAQIGSTIQAYSLLLTNMAAVAADADKLVYFTGATTADVTSLTNFGRSLIDDTSAANARTTLGVVIGTDVQAYSAALANVASLSVTNNNIIVANGTTWTAQSGATARQSLGLIIGTDVQAYDADTLKADVVDILTAGFECAVDDDGTKSSGTYTPTLSAGSNAKKIVNGGAFTLAPPSPSANDTYVCLDLLIVNTSGAGTITTSSFTIVLGDDFTTTSTHEFLCNIRVYDIGGTEYSMLIITALQ